MDRRQRKTRDAIFNAFTELLKKKSYHKITVQEIIYKADVGRSTFYSHFETKDEIVKSLCFELFDHIFKSLSNGENKNCFVTKDGKKISIFCHILRHLKEDENRILNLLAGENNEIFLRFFREDMNKFLCDKAFKKNKFAETEIPEDFLINHISVSFSELIKWWVGNKMQPDPEKTDEYFRSIMSGVFEKIKEYKHEHIWID